MKLKKKYAEKIKLKRLKLQKKFDEILSGKKEFAVRDPAAVCGSIWFHGTRNQRAAFGKGTEGRGRDEHPPKAWWNDCIRKISGK